MRRARTFAAPFILTVVAALPGCNQHRDGPTTPGGHPPEPAPGTEKVLPSTELEQEWSVRREGDACSIYFDDDCPPGARCNPPPPLTVTCPASLDDGATGRIIQREEGGPCDLVDAECPEGGCDPQPAECPSWE